MTGSVTKRLPAHGITLAPGGLASKITGSGQLYGRRAGRALFANRTGTQGQFIHPSAGTAIPQISTDHANALLSEFCGWHAPASCCAKPPCLSCQSPLPADLYLRHISRNATAKSMAVRRGLNAHQMPNSQGC